MDGYRSTSSQVSHFTKSKEGWLYRLRRMDLLRSLSRSRSGIAPTNASPKICSAMAGDSRGRTIAGSFTTVRRRVLMVSPGASVRNWSGGTSKKRNGLDSTIPIIKKRRARHSSQSAISGDGVRGAWRRQAFHSCIPMASGWLYVPSGLKDGPLPTHYEPLESLVPNPMYPSAQPIRQPIKRAPDNPVRGFSGRSAFSLHAHHVSVD